MSDKQRGWATRVVRDHVGAEKFAEALDETFLRDIGEEELERLEAENRRKGLSEESESQKPEWERYAEEMNLASYAGAAVETSASGSVSGLTASEERFIDEMMAEYGGGVVQASASGPASDLSLAEEGFVDSVVQDYVPHDAPTYESGEAERKRLQAALRRVARELEELEPEEEGSEKHRRLKKKYRELQKRIRELPGGDADLEKHYRGDFSEQEDRGSEAQDRTGGGFFGAEEMLKIAATDDGTLPEHMRDDEALKDALLRQNHQEHFADDPNVSGEDLLGAVLDSWGLSEK